MDNTAYLSYLIPALALVWIVYRQFVGRFVPARRSQLLPLVLVLIGFEQIWTAHIVWGTVVTLVVLGDLVLTAVLGAVRGAAIRLSLREGYLFQRGGVPSLLLWLLSIGVRVLFAVLAAGTVAGPATAATLTLSFGVSIAAQYAVLGARVRADGRPIRPAGDRRSVTAGSTLDR
jgi:hypothetical protein